MSKIKVGDTIKWEEGVQSADGKKYERVKVSGVVKEIKDAQELHDEPPTYKPSYSGERKETKFPVGTKTYLVQRDTELPRMVFKDGKPTGETYTPVTAVHESQVV